MRGCDPVEGKAGDEVELEMARTQGVGRIDDYDERQFDAIISR
jgi:hypothetical protein